MTGTLVQLVALTTYGNAYLRSGYLTDEFYPSNTTFQFCKTVEFLTFEKGSLFSKPKETRVAGSPKEWFKTLSKCRCTKLRLYFQYSNGQKFAADHKLAGLVGGGGTWLIEAVYENYSDYWATRWEVEDQNAPDQKIWKVSYGLTATHAGTASNKVELDRIRADLDQTLTNIAEFAYQHDLQYWGQQFDKAKAVLSSSDPKENYYHKDLIILDNYSLTAQQVLFAAGTAWVFGGMGSWNDLGFENKNDEKKFDDLSARLYDDINQSILAAVNSY